MKIIFKFLFNQLLNTDRRPYKFYSLLAIILAAAMIASNVLAARFIELNEIFGIALPYHMVFPGGIFAFPLTFTIFDIVTQHYGKEYSNALVWYNMVGHGLFVAFISIALHITPMVSHTIDQSFHISMSTLSHLYWAACIASACGYLMNNHLLEWLREKFKRHDDKHEITSFIFRSITSTWIGELTFSIVWTLLFLSRHLSGANLVDILICQTFIKVLYEVVMSPVAGAIIWWLKKAEPVSYQHRFTGGAVPPPGFISEERV
ncbi:queuosine precursor transporter [Piscirickettsia salmonis]|uniref:queuosine precursor transporter n=1 Tax=Piscirickettsia salmonis TaxID=1238 RepID=UPI003EC05CDF